MTTNTNKITLETLTHSIASKMTATELITLLDPTYSPEQDLAPDNEYEIVLPDFLSGRGVTAKVEYDQFCDSPLEYETIFKFALSHPRYSLGNTPLSEWESDFESGAVAFSKELYLYDHSGISLHHSKVCQWDSSFIGHVYITWEGAEAFGLTSDKRCVLKEWGSEDARTKVCYAVDDSDIPEDLPEDYKVLTLEKLMGGAVDEYDKYLRGECYYFTVEIDGEVHESCGGFIGHEDHLLSEVEGDVAAAIRLILEEWEKAAPEREVKDVFATLQCSCGSTRLVPEFELSGGQVSVGLVCSDCSREWEGVAKF